MLNPRTRSYLGAVASKSAVVTHLGKGGPTQAFATQLGNLIERHELVKVRFVDHKDDRKEIAYELAKATGSEVVRIIGNTAIFYRQNADPDKRTIELP